MFISELYRSLYSLFFIVVVLLLGTGVEADEADEFFDDSYVHEIRLTFDDSDWYTTLYNSHANDSDDPYFPAAFAGDGVEIGTIGVRFKGNSSFNGRSIKKSIKLDFDEYDEENDELRFFGLKKLNLNNGYKDPTMLREKVTLDFASQYVPVIRAVHTRVYINDEYIGLYLAVEQIDKTFIQDRFGSGEDGNLYKGAASDEVDNGPQGDFGSDLVWEGAEESPYHDSYQLKTNEEENDYSGLVSFIDALNNSDPEDFPETLEPLLDVDNALASMALNNLFMNLDSYSGSAHNYYLYQSDSTGQFSHLFWDMNESFASFLMFWSGTNPMTTDPFWHPTSESRPLMESLWENEEYSRRYLKYMARMLNEGFDRDTMMERIESLADIIRSDLYADNNKEYSNANFESNLYTTVSSGRNGVYGLEEFIEARAAYLKSELSLYVDAADLRINEVVGGNSGVYLDDAGDADSWIEIYNGGIGAVSLSGLFLSDSPDDKQKWALPDIDVGYGDFAVVWLDGEVGEGSDHANFSLSESGGTLYLYDSEGELIDSIVYPPVDVGVSYGRYPDGENNWIYSENSSPKSANVVSDTASVLIYINEVMAENDSTLQDPAGGGYPDWFELYNPNDHVIDLGGMYLTDDTDLPTQWKIPEGVEIGANGFLLIWADNDEEQGVDHANFKISSGGEEIALYDTDGNGNVLIDRIEFGEQVADISYGRDPDGSDSFSLFDVPTPGVTNGGVDDALEITSEEIRYTVGEGFSVELAVDVLGVGPFSYQWKLGGVDITGANGSTLYLESLDLSGEGVYSVVVSNAGTRVEGRIATISVDTSDPLGDDDGDGVYNIFESAFGMDMTQKDSDAFPRFEFDGDIVSITFEALRDDVMYGVQSSSDLVSWQDEDLILSSDEVYSFVQTLSGADPRFYRMHLEYVD